MQRLSLEAEAGGLLFCLSKILKLKNLLLDYISGKKLEMSGRQGNDLHSRKRRCLKMLLKLSKDLVKKLNRMILLNLTLINILNVFS